MNAKVFLEQLMEEKGRTGAEKTIISAIWDGVNKNAVINLELQQERVMKAILVTAPSLIHDPIAAAAFEMLMIGTINSFR